jgi:hypothetical protein
MKQLDNSAILFLRFFAGNGTSLINQINIKKYYNRGT